MPSDCFGVPDRRASVTCLTLRCYLVCCHHPRARSSTPARDLLMRYPRNAFVLSHLVQFRPVSSHRWPASPPGSKSTQRAHDRFKKTEHEEKIQMKINASPNSTPAKTGPTQPASELTAVITTRHVTTSARSRSLPLCTARASATRAPSCLHYSRARRVRPSRT